MSIRLPLAARIVTVAVLPVLTACVKPPPGDRTDTLRAALRGGHARNVILFIGDGMGDSEITMARNYHVGAAGRLALDSLPLTGTVTTYAVTEDNPTRPDYVVDSAASATAWATGHKTSNRRLSTAPGSGAPLETILELAQKQGYATGNVTTAELTDATAAALGAHVNHRNCQGPTNMASCPHHAKAAGGPGSIAEQLVDHHIDVLLGGGRQRFDQVIDFGPYKGQTVIQSAVAQGYTVVTNRAELQTTRPGEKVLGLFAPAEMSPEWTGEPARAMPGSGPQRCVEHQRPESQPSLADMTRVALHLLDAVADEGLFLQVEGALIDKAAHLAYPCQQLGETVAFDAAVAVGLEYLANHPDTLVIVTADHGHSSQLVDPPTDTDHSPGVYSTLITREGAPMTISYATNVPGRPQEHTGIPVRIAAQGPQAGNVVGVIDQTDVFRIIAGALGIELPLPVEGQPSPSDL